MDTNLLRLSDRIATGLELGESHYREFKSALVRDEQGNVSPRDTKEICRDIGEALVAFANADGGELLVGVEDDGRVTGIPHKESLVNAMKEARTIYVHPSTPLPISSVHPIDYDGKPILHFSVAKSTQCVHLTSDGRCLQRFDKMNRPVPTEQVQYERREQISREFDRAHIDGATVKDLDIEYLDSVAKQIAPGYSPEKMLQFLDLATPTHEGGLSLKRAALLLFAKDMARWHPRCEVRILRVAGTQLLTGSNYNVTQDDVIRGNIKTILETAWEFLRPFLARTRFYDALFRESEMYPETACREALVNAVAHRDYSVEGSGIEVLIYDDRLEIRSPGSLLSSISLKSLTGLQRSHQSRNVLISRVLRELGYMREMGEGIPRIYRTMREHDLVDPEFQSQDAYFTVTLHHKSIFSPKDIEWVAAYKEFGLSRNEQKVALLGRDSHLLATNEIVRVLGIVDTDDFRALYEGMRRKGVIFNAKHVTAGGGTRRREAGRFQIRPPQEAQQYLDEFLAVIRGVATPVLTPVVLKQVGDKLSPGSPYKEHPLWSLQALGLVDNHGQWLPKAKAFAPAPSAVSVQPQGRKHGTIKYLNQQQGFGFIGGTDGEDYFLHCSAILPPTTWAEVSVGLPVSFNLGERQIPGKARPAVTVRREV